MFDICTTWTTNPGNANWFGQTTVSYYDGDAAQSGSITHDQATSLQTTVTGPRTLTFYWKVDTGGSDYLRFYLDREQKDLIAGITDWQQKSYYINYGHTLWNGDIRRTALVLMVATVAGWTRWYLPHSAYLDRLDTGCVRPNAAPEQIL